MNYCQFRNDVIKRMANAGSVTPVDPNIVLLLPLNGNVTDYSVNGYTATIHGTVTYSAGYFPGTLAYASSDHNYIEYLNLPVLNREFSVDYFVKTTAARAIRTGSYAITVNNNSAYGGFYKGTYNATSAGNKLIGYVFSYDMWYHVAATRDSANTIRFFVNGALIGSTVDNYRAGTRTAIDTGQLTNQNRIIYCSNYRLSSQVLHDYNNGTYTYPVPTQLYH